MDVPVHAVSNETSETQTCSSKVWYMLNGQIMSENKRVLFPLPGAGC